MPVPSRSADYQEFTRTICAEGLKYRAPFSVSCFFQDSSEIHINVIWTQQISQFFNFHLDTSSSFQVLFRSCNDRSCSCSSSKEEFEFCNGVGGLILPLDKGGAFTCVLSYLISSCVIVQQCARFVEKEKDCGSTYSQPERHEKPITKLSDHRRKGNKQISNVRHHTHFHLSVRLKGSREARWREVSGRRGKRRKNSQGKDPKTFQENSQGKDPRTFEENSQGKDPRTFEENIEHLKQTASERTREPLKNQ